MAIEVTTATAPAHWASYLINGDASGFDYSNTPNNKQGDKDQAECDAWTERLYKDGGWYVVSAEGKPFYKNVTDANVFHCEALTYILHRQVKELDEKDQRSSCGPKE